MKIRVFLRTVHFIIYPQLGITLNQTANPSDQSLFSSDIMIKPICDSFLVGCLLTET